MRRILAIRGARTYILASTVSSLGDYALWLAMGIWVKSLTGSSSAAGLVFFCYTLGSMCSPLTGIIVDRVRRRPLLILVNLITAVMICSLLFVHGRADIWLIYVVLFLYGVAGSVTGSAQSALLPRLVDDELLGEANGLLQTAREGLRLVTPLLGAGLYAWIGADVVVLVDAASFVIASALLLAVSVHETRPERDPDAAPSHWFAEASEGARFLFHATVLRQQVIACAVALLVIGFFETIPFSVVTQGLHHSPSFMGVLEVLMGVGAILGGLTAAALLRRLGGGYLVSLALAVLGAGCPLLALSNEPLVLVAMMTFGVGLPWLLVGFTTTLQRRTPSHLMGRANGATDLLLNGPQTASIALGAMLVTVVAYQDLLYVMAVVLFGCALFLVTRPAQRQEPAAAPDTTDTPSAVPGPNARAASDASSVSAGTALGR